MYGKATLEIPQSGVIGPSKTEGLSDEMAMTIGRAAAWTLSERDEFVTVTLESGSVRVIGQDTVRGKLTIGHSHPSYRPAKPMRLIPFILGLLLMTGCDLYRTNEGVGVLGPSAGWFVCYDELDCAGH